MSEFQTYEPDWPVRTIRAFTVLALSTGHEPVSFDDNSLRGKHCRELLEGAIKPRYPVTWLKQIHSSKIVKLPFDGLTETKRLATENGLLDADGSDAKDGSFHAYGSDAKDGSFHAGGSDAKGGSSDAGGSDTKEESLEADGSYTDQKGIVCAVVTADCLPIVFTNSSGSIVGIVHAGRKGLYNEIIGEMFYKLGMPGDEAIVWIGPGISQKNYAISREIRDAFVKRSPSYAQAFQQQDEDTFLLDLYSIARQQLKGQGVSEKNIFGANYDTYSDTLLHSARRDKSDSGRMVTVVWIKE